jgi:hypothetical protein
LGKVHHRQAPVTLQCVEYFGVKAIKLHVSSIQAPLISDYHQ